MPQSTISLPVNTDNDDGTTPEVTVVFSLFDNSPVNRCDYISEDHSLIARDTLKFYRTIPKKSGNFNGTAKSAFKFTKDFAVDSNGSDALITAPAIVDVGFSFPIGMTPAQTLEMRMRAVALLQTELMADLADRQILSF